MTMTMTERSVQEVVNFWKPLLDQKEMVGKDLGWKPCLFLNLEQQTLWALYMRTEGINFESIVKVIPIEVPLEMFTLSKLYWKVRFLSKIIYRFHLGGGRLTNEGNRYLFQLRSFVKGYDVL